MKISAENPGYILTAEEKVVGNFLHRGYFGEIFFDVLLDGQKTMGQSQRLVAKCAFALVQHKKDLDQQPFCKGLISWIFLLAYCL